MTAKACLHCRKPYEALTAKSLYCSGRCRAAASRSREARAQAERDTRLRGLLDEALRVLGSGSERESSGSRV